ncbi:nitrile hydratase subunit beta [Pseudahrensia aquimaris]|uniref:Nitrile hydratase subunit beta n=1 Tax=Pseudahrensia aquimaris TaxID=744461 RepID=A0ABW3FAR1_9HYPH
MNGGQDLGGMQGFGPVVEEINEPQYHADWEARAMAIVVALGACGQWNIDQSRHARETLPPADYLSFPYYRIWFEGVQKLMLERGMIHAEELDGKLRHQPIAVKGRLEKEDVWTALHALGGAAERPADSKPAFAQGDAVTTININPTTHTRLPRYARGKTGTITKVLGHHVFPDSAGNGLGDDPKWLYQVRFSAQELWGEQANPRDCVTLDLWEPHFVRA